MNTLTAVVRNGQLELPNRIDLPDGTWVKIRLLRPEETDSGWEDANPMTPEEIALTLAAMEKVQPFEMTDEERADIESWRQKIKEYTIANTDRGIEDLFP